MTLGGTVQELKQRMTYREALQWFAYRAKHGGIGHSHIVYLLGCLATMTNNAAGGKAELQDFLPGLRRDVSPDEFMNYISAQFS